MATALSVALGNLRFLELPNGGSVSLATIPLLVLALRRGVRPAALAGIAAGLIHATYGGRIVHPVQFLLDYGIGSMAAAAAAIARGRQSLIPIGILLAGALQFAAYVVSGVVFFAAATTSPWAVSALYNGSVVAPETILALMMVPPVVRALDRVDPQRVHRRAAPVASHTLPRPYVVAAPAHHHAALRQPTISRTAASSPRVQLPQALSQHSVTKQRSVSYPTHSNAAMASSAQRLNDRPPVFAVRRHTGS